MAAPVYLMSGARVLYAPVTAAKPSDHDVDYGAALTSWPTGWKDVGYTNKATSLGFSQEKYDIDVQQSTIPLGSSVTSESAPLALGIVSFNSDNLLLAFPGSSAATTAASPTAKAVTVIGFGGAAIRDVWQWCIEAGKKDDNNVTQPVRVYIHRGEAALDGEMALDKAKETAINLTVTPTVDTTKAPGYQMGEIHIVTSGKTA